jgi:Glycosyltransferase family 87
MTAASVDGPNRSSENLEVARPSRRFLPWVFALSLVILCLAYQVPASLLFDVGERGDADFLRGFYYAERQGTTSFRWSGPSGEIVINGAGGRPWQLRIRASGLRPTGPALLKLVVNGRFLAERPLGGDLAEYQFEITRGQAGSSGNLVIELASDTFVAPPDQRQLGLMVDWVELNAAGSSATVPPWVVLVGLLLSIVLCFLAVERMTFSQGWAMLAGLLVMAGAAASVIWARQWVSSYLPWLVLTCGLFWLLSRRWGRALWWEWLLLVGLAVSAAWFLYRALAFSREGLPPGDFSIYFEAARSLRSGGPLYDFAAAIGIPNGPVYKYPPLFAVLLAPATGLSSRIVSSWWFWFNLALLGLTGYMFLRIFRRLAKPELVVAGAYVSGIGILLFRPAWESMIRGQMDVLILAATVAALWLLQTRRSEWLAGALLGFVTLLKLYPGLFVLYLLWQRRWRALVGFGVTILVLIVVSGAASGWLTLWRYLTEVLAVQTAAVPYPENQSYDGFLSRLVVPAGQTTWYSTVPFPSGARLALYLLDVATLAIVIWLLWRGSGRNERRFLLGYVAVMPLIVLMWPTAWIHYETLLLLPLAFLLWDSLRGDGRHPARIAAFLVSYLLIALGNEYLVLTTAINQDGPVRLLQSYKLYGVLLLLGLLLWSRKYDYA